MKLSLVWLHMECWDQYLDEGAYHCNHKRVQ